jgi:hypothetical protein
MGKYKYKEGEKVRVIKNCSWHRFPIGSIIEVTHDKKAPQNQIGLWYESKWNEFILSIHEDEIESIETFEAFLSKINQMETKKTTKLLNNYDSNCNELINAFIYKQELDFDGWIGDNIGEVASFSSEYFFNLSDIIIDLKTNQPKGLILEWQNNSTEFNLEKKKQEYINYKSYTMGLRYNMLKEKK